MKIASTFTRGGNPRSRHKYSCESRRYIHQDDYFCGDDSRPGAAGKRKGQALAATHAFLIRKAELQPQTPSSIHPSSRTFLSSALLQSLTSSCKNPATSRPSKTPLPPPLLTPHHPEYIKPRFGWIWAYLCTTTLETRFYVS